MNRAAAIARLFVEYQGPCSVAWHTSAQLIHAAPLAVSGPARYDDPVKDEHGSIGERLSAVRAQIEQATLRAGRPGGSVKLVAVSKTKPVAAIREAYAAGQRDFGENYAQELVEKANALRDLSELRFHFIGTLQRNKARDVVSAAALLHTVDRIELAEAVNRRAAAENKRIDVLVEVHLGGEATKGGVEPEGLGSLLAAMRALEHIAVRGLMAIPPPTDDERVARGYFATLRALRDAHGGAEALPELSMGMSSDYEAAIAEGATLVRVGTAIFGARG